MRPNASIMDINDCVVVTANDLTGCEGLMSEVAAHGTAAIVRRK